MGDKMKKLVTPILALALALAGCAPSGSLSSTGAAQNDSSAQVLSASWQANSSLSAADVAADLMNVGICNQILDDNTYGYYANDSLTDFNNGFFMICNTWPATESDPSQETCAAAIYVNAGTNGTYYDPQRSLAYEDGMSVALFYGNNYQVEISPINGGMVSESDLTTNCAALVARATSAIGGSRTDLGQYASSNQTDFGDSDYTDSGEQEQASNMVAMPNLIGSIDGQAKNWLFSNGYRFSFNNESIGYNPKTSCLYLMNNVILDQQPRPGTLVTNDSLTYVKVYVDCEW
jgi:hypothetical protein